MDTQKYLSLEGLTKYDVRIKAKVEDTQPQEELPEVVDLLCTDFRGKVVQVYNVQKSPSMNNSQMQKTEHSEDKQDEIYEEENDEF